MNVSVPLGNFKPSQTIYMLNNLYKTTKGMLETILKTNTFAVVFSNQLLHPVSFLFSLLSPLFHPICSSLSSVGWGVDQGVGGFGDDPGVKAQILTLIRSVRTVMRVPLIIVNTVCIVLLLLFG